MPLMQPSLTQAALSGRYRLDPLGAEEALDPLSQEDIRRRRLAALSGRSPVDVALPPPELPEASAVDPLPVQDEHALPATSRMPSLPPPPRFQPSMDAMRQYREAALAPPPPRPTGRWAKVGEVARALGSGGIFGVLNLPEQRRREAMAERQARISELERAARAEELQNYQLGSIQQREDAASDMAAYRRQMGEAAITRADATKTRADALSEAGYVDLTPLPDEVREMFAPGATEVQKVTFDALMKKANFEALNESKALISAEANKTRQQIAKDSMDARRYAADKGYQAARDRIDAGMRKLAKPIDKSRNEDRAEQTKTQMEIGADAKFVQNFTRLQSDYGIGSRFKNPEEMDDAAQAQYFGRLLLINKTATQQKQSAQDLYEHRLGVQSGGYKYPPMEGEVYAERKLRELAEKGAKMGQQQGAPPAPVPRPRQQQLPPAPPGQPPSPQGGLQRWGRDAQGRPVRVP